MDFAWTLILWAGLLGLAIVAYAIRALDLPGAVASFLLGAFVAYAGGLGYVLVLVTFTGIGVIVTRAGFSAKAKIGIAEGIDGERGIGNVLANGGAAGLAAMALFLQPWVPETAAALAFVTAVAAVTADTMASELGALYGKPRLIIPPFKAVPSGTNGGVSKAGQLAAGSGATVIALAGVLLIGLPWYLGVVAALAGFLGCQLDSVLGATLERDIHRDGPLGKGDVNFISSAVPALLVLVPAALFL